MLKGLYMRTHWYQQDNEAMKRWQRSYWIPSLRQRLQLGFILSQVALAAWHDLHAELLDSQEHSPTPRPCLVYVL